MKTTLRDLIECAVIICGTITIILAVSCISLTDEQRTDIEKIISAVPIATATPLPQPTPVTITNTVPVKHPDVSVGASLAGVAPFAEAHGIPVASTGRGDMLDMRGMSNADALIAEWCELSGGAACPALTDAEPDGIFHQCH